MVAVPEVSDDPTGYPAALADAGYFEGLSVTDEDRERTSQYQGNKARDALKATVTDLPSYLRGLEMRLVWKRFDRIGLQRIVQLINKSNQFNLTTRRYTDEDVISVMADPDAFGLQLRLLDRFGDNGIIAIIIGRLQPEHTSAARDLYIDTWLMSCRVLGPTGGAHDAEPDRPAGGEAGRAACRRANTSPPRRTPWSRITMPGSALPLWNRQRRRQPEHPGSGSVHPCRNVHPRSRGLIPCRLKSKSTVIWPRFSRTCSCATISSFPLP